jgi:hypothetical protein
MSSDTIHTKVVGLTFHDNYPNSILEEAPDFPSNKVFLRREPANPYDSDAIGVYVGLGTPIGHLPADLAAQIAPEMDAGVPWEVDFAEVVVHPDNPTLPGVSLLLRSM